MKIFVIPGDPTPLARPRLTARKIYDSQKNIKLIAAITLQQQIPKDFSLLTGPLHLNATFYMKTPQSVSAKRRESLYGTYHVFKGDLDNYIKYVADICSNLLYHDDCIIAVITAKKIYDEKPRTEFTLRQI